jgi:AraC-like DNA-binding protein
MDPPWGEPRVDDYLIYTYTDTCSMEFWSVDVEKTIIHCEQYRRRTAGALPLSRFGFFAGKTEKIDRALEQLNLSLVLRGDGVLEYDDHHEELHAPFVLLLRPGKRYRYHPVTNWDEVSFVFESPLETILNRWHFDSLPGPVWPMRGMHQVRTYVDTARELSMHVGFDGIIDQIDRLAELILVACIWGQPADVLTGSDKRLFDAQRWLRCNYDEDITISAVASSFCFSAAAFRRLWRTRIGGSPLAYLRELRFREAARMLLETNAGIGEIAHMVGFSDQRYFSKAFRHWSGRTPTDYRAKLCFL